MPGYDQTGPNGAGPMTGRGLGPCGRGLGFGRGFRWRRPRYFQPREITKDEEKECLKEELENLKQESEEIQKRLKELK
jgi:hypothetical protein